jgi:hypothetical protein
MVNVDRTVTVDTEAPVKLAVPINIKLNETPFGDYIDDAGQSLEDLADKLENMRP